MELDFDDILLMPRCSDLCSRRDVYLEQDFGRGLRLKLPIIASPMVGITGRMMVLEMAALGGIGILPRFYSDEQRLHDIQEAGSLTKGKFGVAIGLTDHPSIIECAIANKASIICVDVANGYIQPVRDYVRELRCRYDGHIMAGNVVTQDGALALQNAGATMIRVGIGSGQLCTTRKVTGVGRKQLSAIAETSEIADSDTFIIADGGIRCSGDIVKALAFGADAVMIGTMFGRCYEASNTGLIYGMASRRLQEDQYEEVRSIEGIEMPIMKDVALSQMIHDLEWGIRSACTYVGASDLDQLREEVEFTYTKG